LHLRVHGGRRLPLQGVGSLTGLRRLRGRGGHLAVVARALAGRLTGDLLGVLKLAGEAR
jgi:hypothetical protein